MNHGSTFTGIGPFEMACDELGINNLFHCEINPTIRKFIQTKWPKSNSHADIKETNFTVYRGRTDFFTGGFPCQDISLAGNRAGIEGERSGLFKHDVRAVDESRPTYAVWENVGEVRKYLPTIVEALSEIGYCLQWTTVRASWFGLPHQRERVFGIAYNTNSIGWEKIKYQAEFIEKTIHEASKRESSRTDGRKIWAEDYSEFLRMDDGLSKKLVAECITAYGNAIVPSIAKAIIKGIKDSI